MKTTIGRVLEHKAAVNFFQTEENRMTRLLSVSGVGGVGKSTFVRSVAIEVFGRDSFVIVDENSRSTGDGRLLLSELSRQLKPHGFESQKFHRAVTKIENAMERLRSSSEEQSRAKGLIEDGIDAAASVTAGSPTGRLASRALKPIVDITSDSWDALRSAHRLSGATAEREALDDPFAQVTRAFLNDLSEFVQKERKKICIVFDTFEKLGPQIEPFVLDYLLPSIISEEVPLDIIVSGRFPLSDHDSRWIDYFGVERLTVPLQPFSVEEVQEYIEAHVEQVTSNLTAEALHAATGGLPFLLERWRLEGAHCLPETTENLKNAFDRFTFWLNEEQRQWIRKLSLASSFDYGLVERLFPDMVDLVYDTITKDASICSEKNSQIFEIQEILRQAASEQLVARGSDSIAVEKIRSYVTDQIAEAARNLAYSQSLDDGRIFWLVSELLDHDCRFRVTEIDDNLIDSITLLSLFFEPIHDPSRLLVEKVRVGKKSPAYFALKAAISAAKKEPGPSLNYLTSLHSQPKASWPIQLATAMAYRRSDDFEAAQKYAEAAKEINKAPKVLLELGIIYMMLGKFEEATQTLSEGLRVYAADSHTWAALGEVHRQNRSFEESVFAFEMAIDAGIVPDFVYAEYACSLVKVGRVVDAREFAQKAVDIAPTQSWNVSVLAYVEKAQGNNEVAKGLFSRALALANDNYSRACVYALNGVREEALHFLELALLEGTRTKSWARFDPDWMDFTSDADFCRLVSD